MKTYIFSSWLGALDRYRFKRFHAALFRSSVLFYIDSAQSLAELWTTSNEVAEETTGYSRIYLPEWYNPGATRVGNTVSMSPGFSPIRFSTAMTATGANAPEQCVVFYNNSEDSYQNEQTSYPVFLIDFEIPFGVDLVNQQLTITGLGGSPTEFAQYVIDPQAVTP